MKTLKLLFTIIGVCTFTLAVAQNTGKKQKTEDVTDLIVEKLNIDVTLTDSQKVIIKNKINNYFTKVNNISKGNSANKQKDKVQAAANFELSIDSILTPTQIELKKQKIRERENIENK
ncbi:MAG: hypothetical protein PHH37_01435 [Paludibacter sp.]|nr:hypothetical protein [Paludibacter sp.]